MTPMTEADLCVLIDRQSKQAIGADDLSQEHRTKAMAFYLGEAKDELSPPDTPGRSKVVSKDLMDTVEWAMPSLMDTFCSSDDIVRFEPDGPEDDQTCQDATNYVGWLIHRKNEDGFITLHDAIKSALMMRAGWGKTYVCKYQEDREERYEGLSLAEVQALESDPEVEIVAQVAEGPIPQAGMVEGLPPEAMQSYGVLVKRKAQRVEFKNEGVPPEEMRLAKDTRVLSECRFIEQRREVTLSYLREQGYDEAKIESLASDQEQSENDDAQSRHDYDGSWPGGDEATDDSQRKVELSESYLLVDYDGDGKTEYRRVVKAANVVFENETADDHPFWLMTPILMPYKAVGLGLWDLVEDLQRIKTALWRQTLDSAYLSNNPRTEVVMGKVDLDDVLSPRPGGVIRVREPGMMREVAIPFLGEGGLAVIDRIDQVRDTRTGVTELNSAFDPESLSKGNVGSEGVQALMNAGAQRVKLIARVLAETGFKRMYYLMLKCVSQHQDRAQQVKINGRWLTIDPREWKNRYNMTVSVGVGTFGRQQQIANLTLIGEAQERVAPYGLATPTNVYQTVTRLAEAMGYRDSDQFFSAPQEGAQPQQQQGDPTAQALIAAEQVKAQASLQKAQMDNETKVLVSREEIASKERVAMFEARERLALEQQRMVAEHQRAMNRPQQEFPNAA